MLTSFDLGTSYSFISVYEPNLEEPHNYWNDQEILQGFSWRTECVSFRMLNSCRLISIEVCHTTEPKLREDSVRAIQVPFTVTSTEGITIQGVPSEQNTNLISISQGHYALIFETGFKEEYRDNPEYQGRLVALLPTWCRFTFVSKESAHAEILRVDSNLSPTYPLLIEANSA